MRQTSSNSRFQPRFLDSTATNMAAFLPFRMLSTLLSKLKIKQIHVESLATLTVSVSHRVGSGLKSGSGISTPGVTIFLRLPSSPLTIRIDNDKMMR